jgi:hypothetical protein
MRFYLVRTHTTQNTSGCKRSWHRRTLMHTRSVSRNVSSALRHGGHDVATHHASTLRTRSKQGQQMSVYVRIRQHTSAYVSRGQHTSAYVRIRHKIAGSKATDVSIRQHTCAHVSIPYRLPSRLLPRRVRQYSLDAASEHRLPIPTRAPSQRAASRSLLCVAFGF